MNITDRRRLLGPLNAKVPRLGLSSGESDPDTPILAARAAKEIRKFFIKTGLINNANGSSYLEVDDTIIEVAVFGPRPIRGSFVDRASFSVECKFLPYIEQPYNQIFNSNEGDNSNKNNNGRSGLTNVEQKISTYVETALLSSIILEKYPKSTIDIFINIISFNSSKNSLLNLINWVINSSSVALVDAGIEVKDMVTSGQVNLNENTKEVTFDPETSCSQGEYTECIASFMNMKNNEIVAIWIEGQQSEVDEEKLTKLIDGCNDMSKQIRLNINSYLLDSVSESR